MKVSDAYPSNFIKATDLQDRNVLVKMNYVKMEKIGEDEKPVLYFIGKSKGLVLNKTNATNIATAYGDDMEDWSNQEIVLFPAMVDFQGRTVEAIRVRAPQAKDRKHTPPTTAPQRAPLESVGDDTGARLDDEIPF